MIIKRERNNIRASWIVHLRVADIVMDMMPELSQPEFVFGNIAPDSGVPNEDWSDFTPSAEVSHFRTIDGDGLKNIHIEQYIVKYLTSDQRMSYNSKQKAFYLGYLTHLLTDIMWVDEIVRPSKDKFKKLFDKDKEEWIWTLKKDWYDLDFLYMKKHPNFRAFSLYREVDKFSNDYLDFFSEDAYENRRDFIISYYSRERDDLLREYVYLSKEDMDRFVTVSANKICCKIKMEFI